MSNEKLTMTNIGKINSIEEPYRKLLLGQTLTYEEKSRLLSVAIVLLREYEKNRSVKMFFELSYEIIARYSITFNDYTPLYDFSLNYGFFPIVDYILEKVAGFAQQVTDVINIAIMNEYRMSKFMPTLQQHKAYKSVLSDDSGNDISFIAPTSFGKSELIISHIKKVKRPTLKAAIIVPSKSLLMQTYKYVKEEFDDIKIILHDQMFSGEISYIAVLTQERALRLLERHNTFFDFLYIDEAHNLFDNDVRNRLLARLIRLSRKKNPSCEILYFSPLVQNSNNLKVLDSSDISEYRIDNNIKIPSYYLYEGGNCYIYNRFFNQKYDLNEKFVKAYEYIRSRSTDKNLLYINSPKRMEKITIKFASELEEVDSPAIKEIIESVKKHVHSQFQMIPLIKKGVVYLHGKLPDYVKDYIEYKAAITPEIKYISANSVLLEGINLPISSLFILAARGLDANKLINLSGRVNRLNSIFGNEANIEKLFPPIHFVSNEDSKDKMSNYLIRVRSNNVIDSLENPFLEKFDIESITEEKQSQTKQLLAEEEIYFASADTPEAQLYQKMISLSLNVHLVLDSYSVSAILSRINSAKNNPCFKDKGIVEKVVEIFLNGPSIIDPEIQRLKHQQAINYYQHYLYVMRKRSLQQNITYEYKYFLERQKSDDPYIFMGKSYGEYARPGDSPSNVLYVDLRSKTGSEMINLSIIKLKIEDDFLSYKFNKFIEILHDYGLITDEEYNLTTYGTDDEMEINLVKQGLPIHLVSKLTREGQLHNLSFNENNILLCNSDFEEYYETLDDFYKYQINKYVYIEK